MIRDLRAQIFDIECRAGQAGESAVSLAVFGVELTLSIPAVSQPAEFSLVRHGILPVALAPGRGTFAAAFAAGDNDLARATLRHPEDFGVAAARIGGAPAWLSKDNNPGGSRAAAKQRTS